MGLAEPAGKAGRAVPNSTGLMPAALLAFLAGAQDLLHVLRTGTAK